MNYLPWIAGGAVVGLAARRGRRAPREGLSYFSAEAIQKKQAALGYKSRSLFAYMPPAEFLALAMPHHRGEERASSVELVTRLLGASRRFYEALSLAFDETGQVREHEGRHRAAALLRMGVARVPVELRSSRVRWSEQDDPSSWDYEKKLPAWLLSEKPDWPPRDMAAWRQKRVAAPWYTQGPERGQLRPEYRVPSTGRAAKR